jgi:ABC-type transport system involved in multi-copper enzyme maturation permease subunit
MRALVGILLNTFREAVRQPFYYLLVGAAAAALLITLWLPFFTFYNDVDMYKDLGLSFILVFVLLAGLLAAATGIAREVEDKTAQTILAKALGRWQFVLGKYLGAMAAVLVAAIVLGLVFAAAVYYRVQLDAGPYEQAYAQGGVGAQVGAFRERQLSQALTVIPGLVLAVLQVAVLSAVATALSTRFSAAASVALSLAAFVVGHLTVFLEGAVQAAGGLAVALIQAVLTIMPFLEIFNINQKLSHAILTPLEAGSRGAADWAAVWCYVGLSALCALAYSAAAVSVGILLFRRRSLS